ncbi:hypothetical protein CVT26_004857 [Gymnopilus dilepis]|uniref:Uncharacterized protein n=1 Tax=Gymnopilus dilepis TaxID=231916 RepID=A0A409X4Y7_9AGAR|nr:hypothetical protein CVT26_004857 [Gymnopilus dilepis]
MVIAKQVLRLCLGGGRCVASEVCPISSLRLLLHPNNWSIRCATWYHSVLRSQDWMLCWHSTRGLLLLVVTLAEPY